ncbi:unnamed protein product [Cyprideis torosa]|uniref:Uncharacterized protein n=1 Tax=Cyprideis torosa TaxID=163714 RepID=A0A7R8ZNG6_9CRUS|nr:unnamed protein product [Cyprideis torosa]CAG0896275.1 unnamed protein product [Cyprideis torosa]
MKDHFLYANLSLLTSNWDNVHDFTPQPGGEANWETIVKLSKDFSAPSAEDCSSLKFSIALENAVLPITQGIHSRTAAVGDDVVLVLAFDVDTDAILDFISSVQSQLKETRLICIRDTQMDGGQALDLLSVELMSSLPPVLKEKKHVKLRTAAMEWRGLRAGHDIRQFSEDFEELLEHLYISRDSALAKSLLQTFFNFG